MPPELELELKSFEMLRSLLDELQKQLMRATFAAAGLLLLGIGWFASEDVAAFLKEHPRFAWIVVLALVVGSVLYCYSACRVYKRWQRSSPPLDTLTPRSRRSTKAAPSAAASPSYSLEELFYLP